MPTVLNAANEIAVELFLNKEIKFLDIYAIIEKAMNEHKILNLDGEDALDIIKKVDSEIRNKVREEWGR